MQHKVDNYLFNHKNTPQTNIEFTPTQILFKQLPQTKFNKLRLKLNEVYKLKIQLEIVS